MDQDSATQDTKDTPAFDLNKVVEESDSPVLRVCLETGDILGFNRTANDFYGQDLQKTSFLDVPVRGREETRSQLEKIKNKPSTTTRCSGKQNIGNGKTRHVTALVERLPDGPSILVMILDKGEQKIEEIKKPRSDTKMSNHEFTESEEAQIQQRKQEFLQKAEASALRAIKKEWKDSDYTCKIDAQALIHACLSLSSAMPGALDIAQRIIGVEKCDMKTDKPLILAKNAWIRRN